MTTETMNLHKALSEKKIIDARITKEIDSTTFVSEHVANNAKVGGISVEKFTENARSKLDKIRDLIARRDALSRAIQQSNAVTIVKINGKDYTVAEAIWMKQYGMTLIANLRDTLSRQYQNCTRAVDKFNTGLEVEADKFIANLYGSKEGNVDAETAAKARKDYIDSRKHDLVDPIDAAAKIEQLSEQIDAFMSEVNTALSTSNATTEITIEY